MAMEKPRAEAHGAQAKESSSGAAQNSHQPETDAGALLEGDHRRVEQLFARYEASGAAEKAWIVAQLCTELNVHATIEEEIFYPACREKDVADDLLDEAQVEHDGVKVLVRELEQGDADQDFLDAKVAVLSAYVRHHVAEEEEPSEGVIARARKAGVDMADVGRRLIARRAELMTQAESGRLSPPSFRALRFEMGRGQQGRGQMARHQGDDHRRDGQARFMSDDDDRGYDGRGAYARRYADYDDRRGRSRHHMSERERDEYGRFMSEDDRGFDRPRWSPPGRYRDDDEDRRGWSRREDDDPAERRGGYGYESRGRMMRDADRRDDGNDRRGWYGDPLGHSRAGEFGWEHRRERDDGYDGDRGRSRMRDEDERRSARHGGWYGDFEGRSQTARRGWQER
jgi:Hemerythrin HHE cation binding domain